MASNPPPFQVEDQTDEDFFDKLVNDDDDDFKLPAATSAVESSSSVMAGVGAGPSFGDGSDSDEAKAFANLSISEAENSDNNSGNNNVINNDDDDDDGFTGFDGLGGDSENVGGGDGSVKEAVAVVEGNVEEESSNNGTLVSSNSFAFDTVVDSENNNAENSGKQEVLSDSTTAERKSGGSDGSGVKEVGWSAFHADSAQNNGGAGFGSYSDFFTELDDGGSDPFASVGENVATESNVLQSGNELQGSGSVCLENSSNDYLQYQETYDYGGAAGDQPASVQDVNSTEYWENLYPGWKYDHSTGQWYQMEGYDAATNIQETVDSSSTAASTADWGATVGKTEVSYLQQTAHSVTGAVAESGVTESVTNWNQVSQTANASDNVSNWNQVTQVSDTAANPSDWSQVSQVNNGYPSHMVFDPQYPGWYYDTIAQEWRSLDTYTASTQSNGVAQEQMTQVGFASTDSFSQSNDQMTYGSYGQLDNHASQRLSGQTQEQNWAGSFNNYNQQASEVWQPETVTKTEPTPGYAGNQQVENHYGQNFSINKQGSHVWQPETVPNSEAMSGFGGSGQMGNQFVQNFSANSVSQQKLNDFGGTGLYYENASPAQTNFSAVSGSQGFVAGGFNQKFNQQFNQPRMLQNEQTHVGQDYYNEPTSANFTQQSFPGAQQYSYAPAAGRSSAGRPPHALVTFGFGGKLIVMKDNSSLGTSSFGSQNIVGGSISVLNLAEVVTEKADASGLVMGGIDYFRALTRQPFVGPLTGGSVSTKELNKWIDERIANCEAPDMDYRKGEVLKLLLSLLKIACQYYGKLRSPFGSDSGLKENDAPESAVANLFASAKRSGSQYGTIAHCLQNLPSEGQMRATAAEVQSLLVSGRKKEALQYAQEGQLWGPALVLAAQLGDQFYIETVKQMALRQLVAGSPLRTLCLLIAGQPADVFSTDAASGSSMATTVNRSHQPAQFGANGMLDDWEENLAMITANRTKDDELVLIHLGDCLWKERSNIIAAHVCYLVAEANFESYSDSARLCLIGADHLKFPRTYVSPDAIQRTEIYEYSKVLGNSQFTLLPFQPYKLVYAHMLAEVGRTTDALKYCQTVLKSLKTGRAPEVETLRQLVSSLEERIRTHQQGGFSTNLAPGKLVGKLLNLFDSTAHRVVGGLPPPVPSTSGSGGQGNEHHHQSGGHRVSASQSTMAMSSLMPSASMEPISEWAADNNRTKMMHNRSVSEPDFGRSPRQDQVDSSKEAGSANSQDKSSAPGGTSRFGRFGFGSQLLQKTVGLVLKPRQGRQAKLGESNKFYYDEKLKRWVEEGADPPAEEAALAPPPTTAVFQNGTSDYSLKHALKSESSLSNGSPEFKSPPSLEHSAGMPPLPPTGNQFSARGRMGVRSRYVDTFNQGGGNPTNLFQSPSVPSIKPATVANPKFFVPAPISSVEQSIDSSADGLQGNPATIDDSTASAVNGSFQPPPSSSSMPMQRFASMDNIAYKGIATGNGSFSAHSRRTASWSGSFDGFSPSNKSEPKPLGEVLGMPPSSFMPNDSSLMHSSMNGGSFGDDLHEVEL